MGGRGLALGAGVPALAQVGGLPADPWAAFRWSLVTVGAVALPLLLLAWAHPDRRIPAFLGYLGAYAGVGIAVVRMEVLPPMGVVVLMGALLLASTALVEWMLRRRDRWAPDERPWTRLALPVNSLLGAPILYVLLRWSGWWTTLRWVAAVAVYAFALYAWGAFDRHGPVLLVAGVYGVVAAAWFGWYAGGPVLAALALVAAAALVLLVLVVGIRSAGGLEEALERTRGW